MIRHDNASETNLTETRTATETKPTCTPTRQQDVTMQPVTTQEDMQQLESRLNPMKQGDGTSFVAALQTQRQRAAALATKKASNAVGVSC